MKGIFNWQPLFPDRVCVRGKLCGFLGILPSWSRFACKSPGMQCPQPAVTADLLEAMPASSLLGLVHQIVLGGGECWENPDDSYQPSSALSLLDLYTLLQRSFHEAFVKGCYNPRLPRVDSTSVQIS